MTIQTYVIAERKILTIPTGGLESSNVREANLALQSWIVDRNESTKIPVSDAGKSVGQIKKFIVAVQNRINFWTDEEL